MWGCIVDGTIPDVSKVPSVFTLKGQVVQKEGTSNIRIIPSQL